MKHLLSTFLLLNLIVLTAFGQNTAVTGAWTLQDGEDVHHLFFQDGFGFHTVQRGNTFGMSQGGNYEVKGGELKFKVLYNSADSSNIGQEMNLPFSFSGNQLVIEVSGREAKFNRVDEGKAPLAGVWRITGRMGEDGKVADIHQTGTRQTYKMLTGTKFQWVAIDPAKKQFSGTGGGSYTFKDGKYTENIAFFSRDNSRVGAALSFDGKLENGKWHHSGLSSKGDKIYEVWSKVKL
ncbi:MAG: membrane or secreted protein [Pedobacter sp.]|nr:MAG: membrane or secreted protein [Pedobacter sp.]